jgi:ATP-binding protein involved in chromosome partitioning
MKPASDWETAFPFARFRPLGYHSTRMASEQDVLEALRGIKDPETQKDIVALGLVRDVAVRGGDVSFTLAFASQPPQTKAMIHSMATRLVGRLPGVAKVNAKMGGGGGAPAPQQAHGGHAHGAPQGMGAAQRPPDMIPEVKHTIAVSSGKGGVGKSTVAVNLALALHGTGAAVGIIDADVYGPDLPLMLGTRGRPGMFDNRILPVEAHGLKVMSMGLLVGDREPLVWRGPMIHSFIQQMLRDVLWGALDFLVFDMPPGTGDAQLSLSQVIPLSGVVMVTTPQDVALLDVRKAIGMFQRLNVPMLGVVENMSYFIAPDTGNRYAIFGEGGGKRVADEYGVPLLGQLPLDPDTRKGGDEGTPIVVRRPDSPQAAAFREVARRVIDRLEATATLRPLPTIS